MQSPWLLKVLGVLNRRQPPFLHWLVFVGGPICGVPVGDGAGVGVVAGVGVGVASGVGVGVGVASGVGVGVASGVGFGVASAVGEGVGEDASQGLSHRPALAITRAKSPLEFAATPMYPVMPTVVCAPTLRTAIIESPLSHAAISVASGSGVTTL
jgi:hypothetical protein